MTSKERVAAALRHEQPDRVPLDYSAREEVNRAVMKDLGAVSMDAVLYRLGTDIRFVLPDYIGPAFTPYTDNHGQTITRDIWGVEYRNITLKDGSQYTEIARHPMAECQTIEDIDAVPMPDPAWYDYATMAKNAAPYADEYWIGSGYSSIFERTWGLRGMEQFFYDLVMQPKIACRIMDRVLDFYITQTVGIMEGAKDKLDMVYTYDDMGTQRGMLISPDTWRQYVKPRHAKMCSIIKDYGYKIFYHSCGSIRPIINDLIEIGVDVLNPIQLGAKDMDALNLKAAYGDRLCFHGGVDIQTLLPYADEKTILETADWLAATLGKKGGYIMAPTHTIQPDTASSKVIKWYDHMTGKNQ